MFANPRESIPRDPCGLEAPGLSRRLEGSLSPQGPSWESLARDSSRCQARFYAPKTRRLDAKPTCLFGYN